MSFRRVLRGTTLALAACALVYVLATLPPRPVTGDLRAWSPRLSVAVARGAYHVHTARSDGTGSLDGVARAASRAGLDFVIFTDHGDATRGPEPPGYRSGVLCIDAVEISTTGGHYAALDLPRAPYPLAGEPRAVVEDVARLGGFGIATHPDSRKRSLAWSDWTLPIDAFEWLNADSEWRDERRATLAGGLFHYLLRGPETIVALFDRPVTTLQRWDAMGATGRRLIAVAGMDAHARIGLRGSPDDLEEGAYDEALSVPMPSYESVFRALALRVEIDRPFDGDAGSDARRLLEAIRRGRVFTLLDAVATPGAFEFFARNPEGVVHRMGDVLPAGSRPLTVTARAAAPPGAQIVLLRNGEVIARTTGVEVEYELPGPSPARHVAAPEMIRAEVHVPDAPGTPPVPWIVGNAIYLGARPVSSDEAAGTAMTGEGPPAPPEDRLYAGGSVEGWTVEHDPDSRGAADAVPQVAGHALAFRYALAAGRKGAFVALARRLQAPLRRGRAILLRARADRPTRLSVQLRVDDPHTDLRWRTSVYLDPHGRDIRIPIDEMKGVTRRLDEGRRAQADAVLIVIDRTNTAAGASGIVWIDTMLVVPVGDALRSAR